MNFFFRALKSLVAITINEIFLHLACHGQNFKILCSGIKTEINTGSVKEDDEDEDAAKMEQCL